MRQALWLTLAVVFLSLAPGAHAATVQVTGTPDTSVSVSTGEAFKLSFDVDVAGFTSSQYILQLELKRSIFVYMGAEVKIGGSDQPTPNVYMGDDVILLSDDSLNPPNGRLSVKVRLNAVAAGTFSLGWRLIVTGFQEPPSPPTLADVRGRVSVEVTAVGHLSVTGQAVYNGTSDTILIEASAHCGVCGPVSAGNATYTLVSLDTGEPLGVYGPLAFSGQRYLWTAVVDASNLEPDRALVSLKVTDPAGHVGSTIIPVTGEFPPVITFYTVGVPESRPVKLYVDDAQHSQLIHDAQPLRLPLDGEHKISVDRLIYLGEGVRASCRESQVYTSQVTGSHTFIYKTQYQVKTDGRGGTVTIDRETLDGYYDGGTIITLTASHPDPTLALYKWRINGEMTPPDNPLTVQVTRPLHAESIWEDISQSEAPDSSTVSTEPNARKVQITLTELAVPAKAAPREIVRISLTLANVGYITGGKEIFVYIDDVPRFRTFQFLDVAETRTIVYQVSFVEEGSYEIRCLDKAAVVEVSLPAPLLTFERVVLLLAIIVLLILAVIIRANI